MTTELAVPSNVESQDHLRNSRELARVALICPLLTNYDAIGASARDTYRALCQTGFDVTVLTLKNEYQDVPAEIVCGVADLLLNRSFQEADVAIYHYGIYCELFDGLIAGSERMSQFVRFHNITPGQYVAPKHIELIEKSYRQAINCSYADEIWADSNVNAETLMNLGIDSSRVRVIPLAVESPTRFSFGSKPSGPVTILFVGRFVPSKGATDLIEAARLVRGRCSIPFRVQLVGNMQWSDSQYLEEVRRSITASKLEPIVEFKGTVSSQEIETLYHTSHVLGIPSFHEGFCKPVIEGLRGGCIPVGYAAYNLPAISNGFGRMVPTGDVAALAAGLQDVIESLHRAISHPCEAVLPLDRGLMSAQEFDVSVGDYLQAFTFDQFVSTTAHRVARVFTGG